MSFVPAEQSDDFYNTVTVTEHLPGRYQSYTMYENCNNKGRNQLVRPHEQSSTSYDNDYCCKTGKKTVRPNTAIGINRSCSNGTAANRTAPCPSMQNRTARTASPCGRMPCCSAMPCNPTSCNAMPCNPTPCNAMPCNPTSCNAMPCNPTPCDPTSCNSMPCNPSPCNTMPCNGTPAPPCNSMQNGNATFDSSQNRPCNCMRPCNRTAQHMQTSYEDYGNTQTSKMEKPMQQNPEYAAGFDNMEYTNSNMNKNTNQKPCDPAKMAPSNFAGNSNNFNMNRSEATNNPKHFKEPVKDGGLSDGNPNSDDRYMTVYNCDYSRSKSPSIGSGGGKVGGNQRNNAPDAYNEYSPNMSAYHKRNGHNFQIGDDKFSNQYTGKNYINNGFVEQSGKIACPVRSRQQSPENTVFQSTLRSYPKPTPMQKQEMMNKMLHTQVQAFGGALARTFQNTLGPYGMGNTPPMQEQSHMSVTKPNPSKARKRSNKAESKIFSDKNVNQMAEQMYKDCYGGPPMLPRMPSPQIPRQRTHSHTRLYTHSAVDVPQPKEYADYNHYPQYASTYSPPPSPRKYAQRLHTSGGDSNNQQQLHAYSCHEPMSYVYYY